MNVLGSLNVFEACARCQKRGVYIAVGNHWMNNPYSISKTAAERFALMYNKERGTKIAVVRGLNAYGPRQKSGPVRKIMPNFIIPALKGEPLTVYGDGSQIMDMIYVTDLADILCRALLVEHGVYDMAFEAGTGTPRSVLHIAGTVICVVGSGSIQRVAMRPGEPEQSKVLARPETMGFLFNLKRPKFVSLEEGIAKTVPFYRDQLAEKSEVAA
jgi:UDP-glucose 4-epimerase